MAHVDPQRSERNIAAIRRMGWDAIICAHPKNVLLLAGYYPIIGNSLAITERNGRTTLIIPKDEEEYAHHTNADEIVIFSTKHSPIENVREPLTHSLRSFSRPGARIALERSPISQEASYIGMTNYGFGLSQLVRELLPQCALDSAEELCFHERAVLTPYEQERLRIAATIAEGAFLNGASKLKAGMMECECSAQFESMLSLFAANIDGINRVRGMVSCMSGERSGTAYGAFAMSSSRNIQAGELVLTHCNSHADGFWTDITRTYVVGEIPDRVIHMYEALLEASRIGLARVKAGVRAEEIDSAVREVLTERGFGNAIKHASGHGIGYSAIDHLAKPRLEKGSLDVLEVGMAMNIEPGIYFEGFGGMRQCDMVLVTETGAEVLTPFHNRIEELNVRNSY